MFLTSNITERTFIMSDNINGSNTDNNIFPEEVPEASVQSEQPVQQPSGEQNNSYSTSTEAPSHYSYVAENAPKAKAPKRRHPILKGIAFVLCLAIVGVGSVQGYRIYQDHNDKNGFSEYKEDKTNDRKTSSDDDDNKSINAPVGSDGDDFKSLIELAGREDAKQIPDIYEEILPSVVGVSAKFEYTSQTYDFFGWGGGSSSQQQMVGRGTGIIISEDGYIVTNAHCVYDDSSQYRAGEAIEVSIRFSDQTDHSAQIISYDTDSDIAVLKVNESGLKPAVFGDSNDLKVGELVIAVGNPLGFDLFGSVTSGIISALNRKISVNDRSMNLIQTDAAINEGNSGGPLLNSCGQVIGINSAKMSSSYGSASVEGLGFAIPIDEAKTIIDDLIHYNYVTGRPQFGWTTVDVSESDSRRFNMPMGAYVINIQEDSAAEKAGIQLRDIIIDINGDKITSTSDLSSVKNKYKAGDTVTVTVNRKGEDIKIDVTLQEDKSGRGKSDIDQDIPIN